MGMTRTQKILARHAGRPEVEEGELLVSQVDLTLANDITGPPAIDEFDKIGRPVFNKDKIALVIMIVDSRIGLTKDDLDMKDYLEAHQLRYLIAANKIDKLSNNQLMNNKHKLFKDMDNVVYVSAEKKKNIQEIKDRIMEALG